MMAMKLRDMFATVRPMTTPIKISGMEPKIMNGWRNPLNRNTMMLNIRSRHGTKSFDIPPIASFWLSSSPPHSNS